MDLLHLENVTQRLLSEEVGSEIYCDIGSGPGGPLYDQEGWISAGPLLECGSPNQTYAQTAEPTRSYSSVPCFSHGMASTASSRRSALSRGQAHLTADGSRRRCQSDLAIRAVMRSLIASNPASRRSEAAGDEAPQSKSQARRARDRVHGLRE